MTLVHRRLWPALVRIADRYPAAALAALHEEHLPNGRHRTTTTAFPEWVPADVQRAAKRLSVEAAEALLPDAIVVR